MAGEVRNVGSATDKVAVVREIFGDKADEVLKKSGTLAYDYMLEAMRVNPNNFTYMNRTELYKKAKQFVVENSAENLVPYAYGIRNQNNWDWDYRTEHARRARQEYQEVLAAEQRAEEARKADEDARKADEDARRADEDARRAEEEADRVYIRKGMHSANDDVKIERVEKWLAQLDFTSAVTRNLLQKYGVDATYNIVQHCMLKPGVVMENMGEGFKNSKGAVEYFMNLDSSKLPQVAELTGIDQATMLASAEQHKPVERIKVKPITPQPLKMEVPPLATISDIRPVHIPSQAELQYDELVAQKREASPELMGKAPSEVTLTFADLEKFGCVYPKDYSETIKGMGEEKVNQFLATEGFSATPEGIVPKELAVAMIARVQQRETIARNQGRNR